MVVAEQGSSPEVASPSKVKKDKKKKKHKRAREPSDESEKVVGGHCTSSNAAAKHPPLSCLCILSAFFCVLCEKDRFYHVISCVPCPNQ